MNKKIVTAACMTALFAASVIFGWLFFSTREEKNFLQRNIDQQLSSHFSALYTSLFHKDAALMDAAALADYQTEITVHSTFCTSLFSVSSFSENKPLHEIVLALSQMEPPRAAALLAKDADLVTDIGYLTLHLESEELAGGIWERLSPLLKNSAPAG